MPCSSLPPELVGLIINFSSLNHPPKLTGEPTQEAYNHLRSLCLVDKVWNSIAQSLLFEKVSIVPPGNIRFERLLWTMQDDQRGLKSNVKELIHLGASRETECLLSTKVLPAVLRMCGNLQSLKVVLVGLGSRPEKVKVFDLLAKSAVREVTFHLCLLDFALDEDDEDRILMVESISFSNCASKDLLEGVPGHVHTPWRRMPFLRHVASKGTSFSKSHHRISEVWHGVQVLDIDGQFLENLKFESFSLLYSLRHLALDSSDLNEAVSLLCHLPTSPTLTRLSLSAQPDTLGHVESKEKLCAMIESSESLAKLEYLTLEVMGECDDEWSRPGDAPCQEHCEEAYHNLKAACKKRGVTCTILIESPWDGLDSDESVGNE